MSKASFNTVLKSFTDKLILNGPKVNVNNKKNKSCNLRLVEIIEFLH